MHKITTALAVGAGYVLGARAGRDRYESIKTQAKKVWRDPRVQDATASAKETAGQAASRAGSTAGQAAGQAAQKVKEAAPFGGSTTADDVPVPDLDGSWPVDGQPVGDVRRGGTGG